MNRSEQPRVKFLMNTLLYVTRILIVLPASSLLTSCIFIDHSPYPSRWGSPPSIADNACTDISGTYFVFGEGGSGEYDKKSSFVRFFWSDFNKIKWDASNLDGATRATVEQATDGLRITVWAYSTMIAQKELQKGVANGYSCTDEGIQAKGAGPSVHGLAGIINQTITLFKVSDGSLIIKSQESGGGLALVIPVYSSTTYWLRYQPYPDLHR